MIYNGGAITNPARRLGSFDPGTSGLIEHRGPAELDGTDMQAIYIRTSTTDQDGAAQLHALRRAASARGWSDIREFVDIGHSGAKASRPALDELRREAKAGRTQEVMVYGLDRLGRSLKDLLLLLDDLTASGCAVISLRESIDLATATGRLMTHMLGALAEFERSLIRDRVRSGLERAKAEGTRSGRAIGRPRRDVDVNAARRLRAEGRSWREVAVALKVPLATLRRSVCQNPASDGSARDTCTMLPEHVQQG